MCFLFQGSFFRLHVSFREWKIFNLKLFSSIASNSLTCKIGYVDTSLEDIMLLFIYFLGNLAMEKTNLSWVKMP